MDAVIDPRKEPDDKSEKCGNSLANFLAKSPHDINDKGSDETTYNHLPKRCNKNNNQGKSNKNPPNPDRDYSVFVVFVCLP